MKLLTRWRLLFALLVALLCLTGILLLRLPALPSAMMAESTPVPTTSPPAQTPAPTPVPGAVTVYADGEPVITLSSRADAEELLRWRLKQAGEDIPADEALYSAAFTREMTVRDAAEGILPLSLEQAQALLQKEPALCPVRCVTRTVFIESIPFETEETKDARIPAGARLLLQLGREGERVTVSETTYLNGVQESCVAAKEEETLAPLVQRVAVGTYKANRPNGEPGRGEGEKGPDAPEGFSLALPSKGGIISNFGTREGRMHYGVDINCGAGDPLAAPAAGTVVFAGVRGSYGFLLEIDHGSGFVSRIAPLSQCTLRAGDTVEKGQSVGVLAAPEDEEAVPHLHMELLIAGIPYNPRQYLA